MNRRDLLRMSLAGAGIVALGPLARGARKAQPVGTPINATRLVVINCYGGFDSLNMLVPITNQAYYDRRPTLAITPSNTLALNGVPDHGLHPNMVHMADLFNVDGKLAAIRKVGYPNANLSHFSSQDIYSLGVRDGFSSLGIGESGWLARYAALNAPTPMGGVSIGVGRRPDFIGGSSNPLIVKRLSDFRFQSDNRYSNNHLHRRQTIANILASFQGSPAAMDTAIQLAQGDQFAAQIQAAVGAYQSAGGVAYPTTSPGRQLRDVATLIQAGFETRVFLTGIGGWDTHGNQGAETGRQGDLITRLDDALHNFVLDLKSMNVWNDTVILIVSEFGRRNYENSSGGTDHGHGGIFFATGGPVIGGLYGPPITESDVSQENYLTYGVDFRDVYREAIATHLGADPTPIFPEAQVINTTLNYL